MRLADALVFLCLVTDISATVASIGVKFCTMVNIGSGQIFSPFWGGTLRGPKSEILGLNFRQFDRIYLENSKSQCYISIRA